jgi:beta-phosphoglucomutase
MNKKIFQPTGSTISAVLFDMDGVLIDSIPLHLEAWAIAFNRKKLPCFTNEFYFSMLGCKNSDLLDEHLKKFDVRMSGHERKAFLSGKEGVFRKIVESKGKVTPGVKEWLNYFRENEIRCAVASSGNMFNIVNVLWALDLSEFFTSILSAATLPFGKPNPEVFQLAAASLGANPVECLVIEDALAGIEAAHAAGMSCLAIATSYAREDLKMADMVLDSLSEKNPEEIFFIKKEENITCY